MKTFSIISFLMILSSCSAQLQIVGGPCEGCEAIYEYETVPTEYVDTIPGYSDAKQRMKVYGTVFAKDGHTPAANVIIYLYHTDEIGLYKTSDEAEGWGRRHGRHRGWVRTNKNGRYEFHTLLPGSYPDGREPAHMHMVVKEAGKSEYYIDNIIFEDVEQDGRGGSGVVILEDMGGTLAAKRDIILGLNIPDYD